MRDRQLESSSTRRNQICAIHGMGEDKYVQLQAVMEMARRAMNETLKETDALNSPHAVRDFTCV